MVNKIKLVLNVLLQPKVLKQLIAMGSHGYLKEIGWFNSFKHKIPMDNSGKPLPWVTYGFIDFIEERLNKNMYVFEYGSGNSTLWYAERVASVTAVEHDKHWVEKIQDTMPNNVEIFYQELKYGGEYANFVNQQDKMFDIIIVDGRDRVNCIKKAVMKLPPSGVIVLDDSERETYREAIDFLLDKGFKKIDFWGISPGLFYKKCTTIFYRTDNCLGI